MKAEKEMNRRPATAGEISDYLVSLAPARFPEDRVQAGDPGRPVSGVLVCWMANTRAIDEAARLGCGLILCHEAPFITRRFGDGDPEALSWKANRLRRERLERHRVTVVQSHRTLDALCIIDALADRLGLGEAAVVEQAAGYNAVRLYTIAPRPVALCLAEWKKAHGLERVRALVRDPERVVSRVGVAWGGVGLVSNLDIVARLVELGAEVILGGETEEYTAEFCADAGVDFIELGHAATEAPGMRAAGELLRRRFPGLAIHFFEEWPLMRPL